MIINKVLCYDNNKLISKIQVVQLINNENMNVNPLQKKNINVLQNKIIL